MGSRRDGEAWRAPKDARGKGTRGQERVKRQPSGDGETRAGQENGEHRCEHRFAIVAGLKIFVKKK